MSYDSACEVLAAYFLRTHDRVDLAPQLAQHIQNEIENWIESEIQTPPEPYNRRHVWQEDYE